MIFEALGVLAATMITLAWTKRGFLVFLALIFSLFVAILLQPIWLAELFIDSMEKEGSGLFIAFDNFLAFFATMLGGLIPGLFYSFFRKRS